MIAALIRRTLTALRGRAACQMSMCGRAVRCYGYCSRHLHAYRYGGA